MTRSILMLLLAAPAAARPAAMSATLEALRSEAASDPAALTARENASARAGQGFDHSFTVETLTPVEFVSLDGAPRKNPPPQLDEQPLPRAKNPASEGPSDGDDTDYYFKGSQPLNGITIYTAVKGKGSTSGGEAPTDKYGTYGKYALWGGVGIAAVAVGLAVAGVAGGPLLLGLGLVAGLLIGAGALLSFLFGKKK